MDQYSLMDYGLWIMNCYNLVVQVIMSIPCTMETQTLINLNFHITIVGLNLKNTYLKA